MLRNSLGTDTTSRFHILGPLGAGGFGAVYEAVDVHSGQRLAVKELDNVSADSIARFKHEFRALADCHHPNLVSLRQLIEDHGRWLIVMELVPGSDLTEYIQGEPREHEPVHRFDEGRLRSALSGMVEGLRALHGFGILHRDLKPSNVRVRPDGRAVLLDFGLATSTNPKQQSTHAMAVGTVRYMAPEQAAGKAIGPAADLYALGVCLFEALTGQTPFDGDQAVAILLAKQRQEAVRASSLNASVPPDLDELCAQLLAMDAGVRPSAEQVLRVLGGDDAASSLSPAPALPVAQEIFAGRERELELLERALSATHRGELRIVLVEGESGVGKSELVAEFLRQSAAQHPELVALRGRCYENEQVSYKAFDGCIDELSKVMRRMPVHESAALLPVRAALLGQLFPVLRNIRALEKAPRDGVSADPTARRLEAFEALAQLLSKLAEERPLVLVVDDLQWADAESFRMLQALVERSAPPPLLLLATVRPREELDADVLTHVTAVRAWKHTDVVPLFGLPREQAKALARRLLGPEAPEAWLEMIAEESGGHPLFLSELVQFTQSHDLSSRGSVTLDAALRARIERVDRRARELLDLVAIAARPHGSHVFARALSLPNVDEPARLLLAGKLLKVRKGQELGCFHDRIRRSVSELVGSARSVALHRQLALALASAQEVDPAEQAHHWDLAGDGDRAIAAYELATARAIETLAFTRAAQLCERAIELIANSGDERAQRLTVQRADALSAAGRSHDAALLFQQASERAEGPARIRLRSSAAQQLMLSARTAEGFAAARSLLIERGLSIPLGTVASLLRFFWDSLLLALSAKLRRKQVEKDSVGRLLTLEVLDQLSPVLSLISPITMLTVSTQQLRLALRSGSAAHAGYALTMQGWLVTIRRSLAEAGPLFERSRKLLEDVAHPKFLAAQADTEGSARLAGFDWAGAAVCLERAQALAREHCHDWPWLVTKIRYRLGAAWYHMGEHARLLRDSELWLVEVRERNDKLGEALLCGMGHCFLRHLMRDAPQAALEEHARISDALPPEPFSFAHFGLFTSKTFTLLYQGGPAALHWLESFEPQRKRTRMFKTSMAGDTWTVLFAQALLHAAADATGGERRAKLREAGRLARRLARRSPYMQACADLIAAQVEALAGSRTRALEQARTARARLEGFGSGLRRHAMFLEGALEGGASGHGKCEAASEAYRKEGWLFPLRGLAMSLPTLPLLLEPSAAAAGRATPKLLLGRYEITASLGSGGFGSVVAARDVQTGRHLALKELVRSSGKPLERFKREFRALQDLHHGNLSRLDALLEHEGRWYIAMELVEGSDLLTHVRPNGRCDKARLTEAIAGIARALAALHAAGFVHRDVSPANIRVTREGRAVLLDFGLIARIGDEDDSGSAGALEYASPEQLNGATPHPSSDLYALGACLHEGLTGRPPFRAKSPTELVAQARAGGERLSIAPELEQLYECSLRMLAFEPAHRPLLGEVIAALTQHSIADSDLARARSLSPHVELDGLRETGFSGRDEELVQLGKAFERTCDEGLMLAFVEGESGVGKSALVGEFSTRLAGGWPSLHVLRGRCYENEQLAFKAFDGAVDDLARMLRSLSNPQCETLLPKKAALLALLFPVLTSVPAIAQAATKGLPADPSAQKMAARTCFIELLENLSAQYELLFVIDDLQWADGESFALLHAMLEQRTRLPLLFLCTVRPVAEVADDVAHELARLRALPNSESIQLSGLSEAAASELATSLHGAPLAAERVRALVRESKGHPLFLRELVAHQQRGADESTTASLTLDGALRAHIAGLSAQARELLALVALAGRPLGSHVYATAVQQELPRDAVIALLTQRLVRRRSHDELACFHDRIRRVALEALPPTARRAFAGKLAAALDATNTGEPAERARLWDEADDRLRAIAAYEQAGDRALEGFAFTQAEQHYARALVLLEDEPSAIRDERSRGLLEQRGHALVRAGRSAEAARVYQLAAAQAQGETEVRLRILAARHLIQSAQVDEGIRAASELLQELGLSLPKSDRAALARIAWERARMKLRGSELSARGNPSSQAERLLLEALHGLTAPVRAVWYLPGSTLMAQYLRRAVAAGEPIHAARALAYEALFRSVSSPDSDQSHLFARSRELGERAGEPAILAEIELTQGLACLTRNQFALAPSHLSKAHDLLQTRCPGEPWLLTTARMYLGSAWFYMGDTAAIVRHTGGWMDEARARHDQYALAALTGLGCASMRHLVADRPDDALAELEQAMAPWPDEPFSTNHFGAFTATAYAIAYARPDDVLGWLDAERKKRSRAYLMRTPTCRSVQNTFAAASIMRALEHARGERRRELLARGDVQVRALARNPSRASPGVAALYRGLLQLARGDRAGALPSFARSATALAPLGSFWAPVPLYLEGRLEGGEAGRAKCEPLLARLRTSGWCNQERALAMHVPGLHLVE